jgi:casein kinase II subunit beta
MFVFHQIITQNGKSQQSNLRSDHETNRNSSSWINDFTSRNEWLCVVDDTYVNDNFNLYGLSESIPDYSNALKVVRDQYSDSPGQTLRKRSQTLYGLMHARYILTFTGVKEMQPKYERQLFGTCPRVACNDQPLLPIGLKPTPGDPVKLYCPCCQDIYDSDSQLDGAYFGPYFPHFFLQAIKTETKVGTKVPTTLSVFGIPVDQESLMNRSRHVHGP